MSTPERIVALARSQLGVPYVYGGASPAGFDCSGLSSLFLTTPITFEGRLLQVIGRIMRPGKNKEARVFDYLDDSVSVLRRSAQIRMRALAGL